LHTECARVEGPGDHSRATTAGKKRGILLAEGNPIIRSLVARILHRRGHEVEQVASGEAAVAALIENDYDLALLSAELPGLSGIEATKLIRFARTGRPRLPVIGLVGDEAGRSADLCREAGMDAWLAKSIEPDQLIALAESFMPALADRARDTEAVAALPAAPPPVKTERGAIDPMVLTDLEKLGGKPFVDEIVSQFLNDARITLDALNEAVRQVDAPGFHDQAHALRSCAANVGARLIYEKCLAWRALSEAELATHGKAYVQELEANLTEAARTLGLYLARA
jgi:two-component system sensor histidine kinase RpfC